MKDPINCPICEEELMGHSSRPCGLSPEGWIRIQEHHNREHKDSPTTNKTTLTDNQTEV